MNNIRNFCIIAHIDHGKSTLADRLLEMTETISKREMKAQILDQMDLERERGITIKLQPARMEYIPKIPNSKSQMTNKSQIPNDKFQKDLNNANAKFILNLIDTPGHVDFNYEVSRSLAAVEGALLLVDATQGIQAQTLANLYLALEQNLMIIPVINKIDLPAAQIEKVSNDIVDLLGCKKEEIILTSAKTGEGVDKVLEAIVEKIPAPKGEPDKPLRALIFDSIYDEYKGVVAYVRLVDGKIKRGIEIKTMATDKKSETLEVGFFEPRLIKQEELSAGEIGYIVTGFKDIENCRVGDTITLAGSKAGPLPGYKEVKPMVYAGIFCKEGSDYERLREAIGKLKLNDAALEYEPEHSTALGFGFRCGFLGLLHLEIFQERLKREFGLELVVTVPSVAYKVKLKSGSKIPGNIKKTQIISENEFIINNPQDMPDPSQIEKTEEPIVKADIITPKDYIGSIMQLVQDKRGEYENTEYLDQERVILHYKIPLASVIVDFYDKLKSASSGFASLNYEFFGYQRADVVKLDILVAEEPVEALSTFTYKDTAYQVGKSIVKSLKDILPRQQFVLKIQAAVGGKIIASERLSALRKDVTAKLYGGDWSRRQKLLEKQKKGKKKMMAMGKGKVEIPTEAFLAVLKK